MARIPKTKVYNPQKASAYVGRGVLRKGGAITPVPNGPLIQKKGAFKGSSLKKGGSVKKAQIGKTVKPTADSSSIYKSRMLSDMDIAWRSKGELKEIFNKKVNQDAADLERQSKKAKPGFNANGFPIKKNKIGGKMTTAKTGKQLKK